MEDKEYTIQEMDEGEGYFVELTSVFVSKEEIKDYMDHLGFVWGR